MKSSTPGACKYCGYKGFCGHKYKHDLQELAVVPINSTLIHEVKFVSTVKDLESAYALAMNDIGNLLVSGGIEQVVSVWDPGTGSKNMKWQSSLIRVGGRLTFDVVSAAGKLFHSESGSYSQVDLNSAGVPLLEIVSETDMRTRIETAEPRADAKLTINGVMGNLAAYLINERLSIDGIKLTPLKPFELIASIKNGTIRGKIGKEILDELIAKGRTVSSMMEEKDVVQNAVPAAIEVIGQHKSHYCYFIRLMLEYSKFSSLGSDEPFACKLNNPKHRDTYKQVYVHILNYAADLWEELPKFSMQIVGLFWILPPWPDLSFCEVCWRDMGLENGAGAESRRNAYSIVAGQSKNQLQQTRYKQLNDDIVLKEETALKSLIPVKFNLYWSIIVICYPGEVKTFEDGVPESVCAIWGTQQLTMSSCLNDSGEKVVPASGCILDTGSVSMVAAQNLPKLGVCPPDKDSVFCLSSQEEKTEPPITGSDNQFDMCAGLVGKVERNVPEDDHRSPAGITDKIGDDVGDIAEMGSDLFGSSEEFSCAALVVVSISSIGVNRCFTGMCYPLLASSIGIIVCLIATILATDFLEIKVEKENEPALQKQLIIPTALMMVGMAMFSWVALPDVADPCGNGVTTNVIISLVLGYKLVNIPIFAIAVSIYVSISMTAMYGIAVAVLDMLSTIAIGLAIDAYGSNSDNTGGLAERVGMSHRIPENAIGGIYGVLIPMIGHMFEEVQRPGTPLYKIKTLMKCVMQLWLPVSQALLEMTISHFPSPPKTQKHCVGNLYEGPLVDIYAIAIRKCDSEGPLMLYVSKLIPASDKGRLFPFGHVYSWRVATGMKVLIMGHNYVPGQSKDLYVMSVQLTVIWLGRKLKSVENDPCGNTVTVMGPDQFITKNTTLPNEKEVDACQMKSMKLYVSFAVHVAVQYKGLLKKFLWMRLILPRNISRIVCPDYQILGSRSILEDKYAVEEEEMSEPSILKQLEKG